MEQPFYFLTKIFLCSKFLIILNWGIVVIVDVLSHLQAKHSNSYNLSVSANSITIC